MLFLFMVRCGIICFTVGVGTRREPLTNIQFGQCKGCPCGLETVLLFGLSWCVEGDELCEILQLAVVSWYSMFMSPLSIDLFLWYRLRFLRFVMLFVFSGCICSPC